MDWGFNAWTAKPLFQAGATVGTAQVQLGGDSEVGLVAPRNLAVTIPAGLASGQTRAQDPLPGAGQGADRQGPAYRRPRRHDRRHRASRSMPLVAAEAVGEAGFFGRIWLGLKQLLGMA